MTKTALEELISERAEQRYRTIHDEVYAFVSGNIIMRNLNIFSLVDMGASKDKVLRELEQIELKKILDRISESEIVDNHGF